MRRPQPSIRLWLLPAVVAALCFASEPLLGQAEESLTPGDVVRVDHDFVGTVMSIDNVALLTVIGEGKPRCMPGIMHGDAPRCDPAPSVRRVFDWNDVTLERQLVGQSYVGRTILGFIVGAIAFAPVGYATGPVLGYGKIEACVEVSPTELCTVSVSREEADRLQRQRDQKRGAGFFAAIGGSVGAIIARKTANEWVHVQPPSAIGDGSWSLGVRVPLANR